MVISGVVERVTPGAISDRLASLAESSARTVVLECTDDPAVKFAVNDACLTLGFPGVIGGVLGWRGQAMAIDAGRTCFRCLFESAPPAALAPDCATGGREG